MTMMNMIINNSSSNKNIHKQVINHPCSTVTIVSVS